MILTDLIMDKCRAIADNNNMGLIYIAIITNSDETQIHAT